MGNFRAQRDDGEQCRNTQTTAAKSANDVPGRSDDGQRGDVIKRKRPPKEGDPKERREKEKRIEPQRGEGKTSREKLLHADSNGKQMGTGNQEEGERERERTGAIGIHGEGTGNGQGEHG